MYSDRGRRYEFKVEHGHGGEFQAKNYIKFFIKEKEMKGFTPEMLWQQLKEKCNSANISNIKYMDHDKDWIDLRYSDFESFVDMVESAEVVQHREDILRINLKVFSRTGSPPLSQSQEARCSKRLYSPSPSKQGALKKRTRVRLYLNNEDDGIGGAALDDIDQLAEDEARDGVEACLTDIPKYISPTQKFFAKLEADEKQQHAVVRDNERQISELERTFEQPKNKPKVPLCTNCHTPGHNRANCLFEPCVSATLCRDIKRHPEEMKYLKEKRDELKVSKGKLAKIQSDLKSKREMLDSAQNSFVAKVQTDLINSDPKKYLRKISNGHFVPIWLVVNSDIRKLERVCHGKLPAKAEIPTLLEKYNERFDILGQPNVDSEDDEEHVNPVKHLWEKKGIRFPGHGSVPNTSFSSCVIHHEKNVIDSEISKNMAEYFAVPKSKRDEEYLLRIGLSQSLETRQPEAKDIICCSDSGEEHGSDVENVDMLFKAEKLLEK